VKLVCLWVNLNLTLWSYQTELLCHESNSWTQMLEQPPPHPCLRIMDVLVLYLAVTIRWHTCPFPNKIGQGEAWVCAHLWLETFTQWSVTSHFIAIREYRTTGQKTLVTWQCFKCPGHYTGALGPTQITGWAPPAGLTNTSTSSNLVFSGGLPSRY